MVIGAVGGSGTRVIAGMLRDAGVFIGESLNRPLDSVPGTAFVRRWIPEALSTGRVPEARRAEFVAELEAAWSEHRFGVGAADDPWAIKNPRWAYLLAELVETLADLRFVHVVRDGRDMAFSRNQSQLDDYGIALLPGMDDEPTPLRSIALWAEVNARVLDTAQSLGPERYLRVRFEDLCARPEATAARLLAFADAPAPDVEAAAATVEPPESIGRFRRQDGALVERLTERAGDMLARLGYSD